MFGSRVLPRALVLLFPALFLLFQGVGHAASSRGGQRKGTVRPSYSNDGIPYKETPLFVLDGYPLTDEELKRFSQRMSLIFSLEGHARRSPALLAKAYARFKAVADEGKRLGIDNTPSFRAVCDVYRRAALANDLTGALRADYVPSEQEVRSIVPPSWVQYKFKVVAFPSEEAAAEARKRIVRPGDIDNVVTELTLSGYKEPGVTGFLFKKSGFFEEFDEEKLFSLNVGDVSEVVKTGVGPALCVALDRKEYSQSERDAFIRDKRKTLEDSYVQKLLEEYVRDADYTVDRPALRNAILTEGRGGGKLDVEVVSIDNGAVRLTYRHLRILVPANLNSYFKTYPEENWAMFFEGEADNMGKLYWLSKEAERRGVRLNSRWEKELYDFRRTLLYYETLSQFILNTKVEVSDKETAEYFEKNRDKLVTPARVRVKYIYGPNEEELRRLLSAVSPGESPFNSDKIRNRVKDAIFDRKSSALGGLFDNVFKLEVGATSGVLKGEAGFYVFLLQEKGVETKAQFEELKAQVREVVEYEKRNQAVSERVDKLAKRIRIVEM